MQDSFKSASFAGFGYREMDMAADILKAHANNPALFLESDISVGFNMNSGEVFLFDENMNTAILHSGNLVQFFSCSNCGAEGIEPDIRINSDGEGCNFCRPNSTN